MRSASGRRQLLPHLASFEHVLHLRDELLDQRPAPRRPRGGAGGARVGLDEQVERREPLRRADPRGDVQDQVFVGEVAPRRRVGQQQVLGDEERGELAVSGSRARCARASRRRSRRRSARGSPRPPCRRRAAARPAGARPVGDDVADARSRGSSGSASPPRIAHARERAREVRVDREPVVRVSLWAAADVGPRRQVAGQQIEPVEGLERSGRRHRPAARAGTPRGSPGSRPPGPRRRPPRSRRASRPTARRRLRPTSPAPRSTPSLSVESAPPAPRVPAARSRSVTNRTDVVDVTRVLEHRRISPSVALRARLVRRTHLPRDRGLEIGGEAVGPARRSRGAASLRARTRNSSAAARASRSPRAEQPGVLERKADGLLEPADRRDVAEPADPFFQVGLEQVRGRTEPLEPVAPPSARSRAANAAGSRRAIARRRVVHAVPRSSGSPVRSRASSEAVSASSRSATIVGALIGCADRLTDREARVPERVQDRLGEPFELAGIQPLVGEQQVDVGGREAAAAGRTRRARPGRCPAGGSARRQSSTRHASSRSARRFADHRPW